MFRSVSFAYDEARTAIEEVTFSIRRGERIAIVGESGSGKSTVAKLLQGLYHPTSGNIFLFGCDTSCIALQDIRALCAYVPQDAVAFDGTILENIKLGKSKCTMQEIEHAAKQAGLLEFIHSLPNGFDTQVGERGTSLSGGQRQRLSIARALIKDAPILVLDEATSALDTQMEEEVLHALDALMEGRTTVIIAHRQSAIRGCDRTLVMEQGRVKNSIANEAEGLA